MNRCEDIPYITSNKRPGGVTFFHQQTVQIQMRQLLKELSHLDLHLFADRVKSYIANKHFGKVGGGIY